MRDLPDGGALRSIHWPCPPVLHGHQCKGVLLLQLGVGVIKGGIDVRAPILICCDQNELLTRQAISVSVDEYSRRPEFFGGGVFPIPASFNIASDACRLASAIVPYENPDFKGALRRFCKTSHRQKEDAPAEAR